MSLEAKIGDDMKDAMRKKEELRLSVLRMIRSGILLEKKKPAAPETLSDDAVHRIVQGHVKKVREALETAERVGRADLAEEARKEIAIAEVYLPPALSDGELDALVRQAIQETGASGAGAMGAVMKAVMGRIQGRADGKRVQEAVRRALAAG